MGFDALQVLGTSKKWRRALGLTLSAALAVGSGCEGAPTRSKPWRRAPDAGPLPSAARPRLAGKEARLGGPAVRGEAVTVWLDGDPRGLDPLVAPTEWALRIVSDTVVESLVRYEPGESDARPGGYEPRLARSWRVGADGREIVFELQPAVRFHDGRPMSAADVQASVEAVRRGRGRGGPLAAGLADVAAVDVLGSRTVRVRLSRPNAYVLRALAEVPITPGGAMKPAGADAGSAAAPASGSAGGPASGAAAAPPAMELIGTGPYRVRGGSGGSVELERFAAYWGAKPAVGRVVFRYQPDAAMALRAARSGEMDILPALIREHRGEAGRGTGAGLAPLRLRPPILRYLALNARRPPFDDARVRCAVARLLDRGALVAADKRMTRAVGGPIWPGGPGDGPAMEVPPFDRAGAGALLDQAGWRQVEGLRARGPKRLLLTVLVSDRPDDARERVLDQLRAAGFVLDARVGSVAVLDNRLRDGKFDMAFVEWRGLSGEDLTPVFGTGGALNFGGFSDARVDEALAALRRAWDASARWTGMRRLGALLAETCPLVPLVAPDPQGLVSRRVGGATPKGGWLSLRALRLGGPADGAAPGQPQRE